jgi:excinuclease ABC subunit C
MEIEGLGESRARLLIRKFGSLKRIRQASVEELSQIPSIGPKLAANVLEALTDS